MVNWTELEGALEGMEGHGMQELDVLLYIIHNSVDIIEDTAHTGRKSHAHDIACAA